MYKNALKKTVPQISIAQQNILDFLKKNDDMVKNQTLLQKDSILQNKVNSLIEWLSLERKRSIIFSSIKDILNVLSHYHNADLNLKHQVLNIENFCNNLINVLEANPKVKKTKKSTAQQEIQEVLEVPQLEKKSRVP